ncbi:DUF2059 domain-containing protein [Labrys wisconsinensis]|uniref:DUF2059 domain-containing protein n=1 Tax=Labrys wisconsinensis TaxID=425677 RepID=A0ABU0JCC3_9HYPH|nr:DUF2059 domain-containing protein [Labrys wisconsinensis]MDQ0470924.1 hypothetical protein [Labrys wisconsinensis]
MTRFALHCAVALLAVSAMVTSVSAQEAAPAAPAAAAPATPPAAPSHTAAAVAFLKAAQLTKGFEEMIPAFADQVRLRYVGQRPEVADIINDVTISLIPEFVKRQDDLVTALAKLYTDRFSEDELNQLTQFYQTPLGTKLAATQPAILQASVPIVQEWSRKLTTDMAVRIRDEVKKKGPQL